VSEKGASQSAREVTWRRTTWPIQRGGASIQTESGMAQPPERCLWPLSQISAPNVESQ
jgi:hypothetical protein